ncbi:butyrophilin-like protein 10 [Sardina pilchardus]|uniref:butyrophilin-like protein 10 n=1 Tax=Sardina pilchardus TaxID=27697 RepID=UPI002E0D15C9
MAYLSAALLVACMSLLLLNYIQLYGTNSENFQVVGPDGPLSAVAGEDLVLPCSLKPRMSAEGMTVEWLRLDHQGQSSIVHLYKNRTDLNTDQMPSYRGRTSILPGELEKGDASLHLKKLRVADTGYYKCLIVSKDYGYISIQLNVIAVGSQPVIAVDRVDGEGLSLVCQSSGWNPEPAVDWLDGEGRRLPADPTEWNSDGFRVKRRLLVENWKKNSKYTCRVSRADKMEEAIFHINEGWFQVSKQPIVIASLVAVLLALICGFLLFLLCGGAERLREGNWSTNY